MSEGVNVPAILTGWDCALDQISDSGRKPHYIMVAPEVMGAVRRWSRNVRIVLTPDPRDERKPRRLLYKGVPLGVHLEWSWGWMIRATDKSLWPQRSQDVSMLPLRR